MFQNRVVLRTGQGHTTGRVARFTVHRCHMERQKDRDREEKGLL